MTTRQESIRSQRSKRSHQASNITDVKKTTMPEVITKAIPDYTTFGHAVKL